MTSIGILTDSTALMQNTAYPGCEHVNVIPLHVSIEQRIYPDTREAKVCSQILKSNGHLPVTLAPSEEEFCQAFLALGQKYQVILAILLSSHLNLAVMNAQEAARRIKGPAVIHIIDSQTTAAGLGFLVRAAAEAIHRGDDDNSINNLVRGLIPHIYSVFCLQSLTYLATSGQIDHAQAVVGEMLNMIPFYIMESGRLVPVQKARSPRHLVDMLHEFVAEFDNLKHIAIVQGNPPFEQEARNLRERLYQDISPDSISEHTLSLAMMAMLGPHSLGVFTLEGQDLEA